MFHKKKRVALYSFAIVILIIVCVIVINRTKKVETSTVSKLTKAFNQVVTTNPLRTNTTIKFSNIDYSLGENSYLTEKQVNAILSFLQNSSFTVDAFTDYNSKQAQLNVTLWFDTTRSINFSIYFDSDMVCFYFEELNNKVIYIKWECIKELIPTSINIEDYKNALLSLDLEPILQAPDLKTIYEAMDSTLNFTEETNIKLSRDFNKERKTTKYILTTTTADLNQLIQTIVTIVYNNSDLLDSVVTIFQGLYDIDHTKPLEATLIQNKEKIIDQSNSLLDPNSTQNLSIYTYKDRLTRLTYLNTFHFNYLQDKLTMDTYITSDFYHVKKGYNWLTISNSSINLASLDSTSLQQFYKGFMLSGYTLSLKYPELLDILSTFLNY